MISTSTSNWLDRLRLSRGFPTGGEPDLGRFISLSSSSGSAESATHVRREKTPQWTPPPGEFAAVISDLFNMDGGESSRTFSRKKKASRKQSNPRFFSIENDLPTSSSDDLRRSISENGEFVSSGDYSLNDKKVEKIDCNVRVHDNNDDVEKEVVVVEEEDDDVVVDLKEYSKSEVTVIDTSFEEWKSDKWVFRKNDEWKIKDKKKSRFKSRVCGGNVKKRKLLVNNLGDNKLDDDYQMMMKKKEKKKEDEELNKRQPQNDKGRESFQKRQACLGKVPQKRFPCPRPPEKRKTTEGSPVILIKSIPLNDNNATIKAGKSSQKIRPKKMKII